MKTWKLLLSLWLIFNCSTTVFSYDYRVEQDKGHILHIVTLDPKEYQVSLLKAHDNFFARETVESIAERAGADIAINAGFFEIGGMRDGMVSGTLMIKDKIYGLLLPESNVLEITGENELRIGKLNVQIAVVSGEREIPVAIVNKLQSDAPILYTSAFGKTTRTAYKSRKEITFDKSGKAVGLFESGNNSIPEGGYVVSFPRSFDLSSCAPEHTRLLLSGFGGDAGSLSMVSGIPRVLENGEIIESLKEKNSSFYNRPEARSAMGLKKDGTVVLLIAEHVYARDLTKITLGEVKSLIQNNKLKFTAKYKKLPNNITLDELKEIVKEEFSAKGDAAKGLTILELAAKMKELGCESAINLDGGGSSSLWIEGKQVNQSVGDEDEAYGEVVARPVSDALVFKRKGA